MIYHLESDKIYPNLLIVIKEKKVNKVILKLLLDFQKHFRRISALLGMNNYWISLLKFLCENFLSDIKEYQLKSLFFKRIWFQ